MLEAACTAISEMPVEDKSATAASAAYTAWVAKNCTASVIMSAKYNLGQMQRYFKILKREGKLPIA